MKPYSLFSDDGCISNKALELYAQDKLSSEERRELKNHASHCELCHDALIGASYVKKDLPKRVSSVKQRYYSKHHRSKKTANQSAIIRLIGPLFLLTGMLVVLWFLNKQNDHQNIKRHYEEKAFDTIPNDTLY